MKIDLSRLVTESRNPASTEIDTLSTIEMLQVINEEDQKSRSRSKQCYHKLQRRLMQLLQRSPMVAVWFTWELAHQAA